MNRKKYFAAVVFCLVALVGSEVSRAEDAPTPLDVTNAVRQTVQGNSLVMPVGNDSWGDPAPGAQKKLKVDYTLDGVADSKVVMEYSTLMIQPAKGVKLVVTKAVYGDLPDEKKVDVTGVLSTAIQSDKISLAVNNENMHADPAPFTGKSLEISYTVSGKACKVTVSEGETLNLPLDKDGSGSLLIVRATYGAL